MPAKQLQDTHIEKNGKRIYHPDVVLDLDYTILMPRR
jgi:2-methylfumaryl-CoA hydratase